MLDTGVCDMIMEGYGFFSDTFPVSDVITLPWLVKSTAAAGQLMNSLMADGLLPEYDNIHLLTFKPQDPIMMFFRDKKVTSLEDLKGLKIRTNTPGLDELRADSWRSADLGRHPRPVHLARDRRHRRHRHQPWLLRSAVHVRSLQVRARRADGRVDDLRGHEQEGLGSASRPTCS